MRDISHERVIFIIYDGNVLWSVFMRYVYFSNVTVYTMLKTRVIKLLT